MFSKKANAPQVVLTLGERTSVVPSGNSVMILRNGVVSEIRPILKERPIDERND